MDLDTVTLIKVVTLIYTEIGFLVNALLNWMCIHPNKSSNRNQRMFQTIHFDKQLLSLNTTVSFI